MRFSTYLFWIWGLWALLASPTLWAEGAGEQWDALSAEVVELYRAGAYEKAIERANQALLLAEESAGQEHLDVATSLNNLAALYQAQSQYALAEPLYQRALMIREKALGPVHPEVANSLYNLAALYDDQDQYAKAEPLYRRALKIDEKALGPEHPEVATSLNNLATLYYKQGRYTKAKPLYQRALAIREKALGPEHPEVATSLNNLAALFDDQDQYAEAEPLFQRALQIEEKALGPEHPEVATRLSNVAALNYKQGKHAKAEALYQRALEIREKVFGPDHINVATSLSNLAIIYTTKGRYEQATRLMQRALAIKEKTLGPDDLDVISSMFDLVTLHYTQGQINQAEKLLERFLEIWGKTLDPQHVAIEKGLSILAKLKKIRSHNPKKEHAPRDINPLARDDSMEAKQEALSTPIGKGFNALAYQQAIARASKAVIIAEEEAGPEHPKAAKSLVELAEIYAEQGYYTPAESLLVRALTIREKALGPKHPRVADSLESLGLLYLRDGQYMKAEQMMQRALQINERNRGRNHPEVAASLRHLAALRTAQSQYAQAESLNERAAKIIEESFGPDDIEIAGNLQSLAGTLRLQGKYDQAERLARNALEIREKTLGPEHPDLADDLNSLAETFRLQGNYDQAEQFFRRALEIQEKALGPEHPDLYLNLIDLAQLHSDQGRYSQAEPLLQRALAISEKAFDQEHGDTANMLADIASLYARHENAELLLQRALKISEKSLGTEHINVAHVLYKLANLHQDQGRLREAEPLYQRTLSIFEKNLGADHNSTNLALASLADLYRLQGRIDDARSLYQHALSAMEAKSDPAPHIAAILGRLAMLYTDEGQFNQAAPLYRRALAIYEKALGQEHPAIAPILHRLAILYDNQGHHTQAQSLHRRALKIRERALDPKNPELADSLKIQAIFYGTKGQYSQALPFIRRASQIYRSRVVESGDDAGVREASSNRMGFLLHLHLLARNPDQEDPARITDESFQIAQLEAATGTAAAVAQMAVRFAKGDDAIGSLVKRKQDASLSRRRAEDRLLRMSSQLPAERNASTEAQLRADIDRWGQELGAINAELDRSFPEYQELTRPEPLAVAQVQALLRPREAMLVYALGGNEAWLWIVRPDHAEFLSLKVEPKTLAEQIKRIRAQMEFTTTGQLQKVDVALLHTLYQQLFAPAEAHLAGIDQLMLVPAGPLQSLPFSMLVTSPLENVASNPDYAKLDWLVKRYAISVLPSVSSIRAFRQFAKSGMAQAPFAGFGDPLLREASGIQRSLAINPGELFRGLKVVPNPNHAFEVGPIPRLQLSSEPTQAVAVIAPRPLDVADVDTIRQQVRLPETGDELKAMARIMQAGENTLWLQDQATETNVKSQNLSSYRVIAFATHGVMAGEMPGGMEPGLLLTPPAEGTLEDDGYLSAGEIAQLKLNADWVLLSACNTAAADGTPGAEGLSGLAKAFFYAGARSLLVSHWKVASEATVPLTTAMLQEYEKNPEQGKAEAQRKAMLSLMTTADRPEYAHPLYWAPFVVVGEGAGAASR